MEAGLISASSAYQAGEHRDSWQRHSVVVDVESGFGPLRSADGGQATGLVSSEGT